jgi:hypothetical protein
MGWGPSHQRERRAWLGGRGPVWFRVWILAVGAIAFWQGHTPLGFIAILGGGFVLAVIVQVVIHSRSASTTAESSRPPARGCRASGRQGGRPRPRSSATGSSHPARSRTSPSATPLHLDGVAWELLTLTAAYRGQPWRTLTELPFQAAQ